MLIMAQGLVVIFAVVIVVGVNAWNNLSLASTDTQKQVAIYCAEWINFMSVAFTANRYVWVMGVAEQR